MCRGDCYIGGGRVWRGLLAAAALYQRTLEEENRQLKQIVAEQSLKVDFFKAALQKIAARRQKNDDTGETASTTKCGQ
jgi:hypothetical protein